MILSSNHDKKPHVLHVINGEFYSGAERVQDLLALQLPKLGFQVGFACLKPDRFPKVRCAKNAPIYDLSMGSKFDLTVVKKLASLIKNVPYDLVHTHTPRACMVGRMSIINSGVSMVHHVHSPTLFDSEKKLRNIVNTVTERISLIGVDGIITVSDSLKSYMIRQGITAKKLYTVRNGVPGVKKISLRIKPGKTWTIGTVGLFRPRKGLDILLKAISNLRSKKIDVVLIAVGPFVSIEYENFIKKLAEDLGIAESVEWTGFVENVDREFERFHAFVLPSLFGEGIPMVLLEAMTSGLPVIVSSVDGITEVVRNEKEGLLFKPGSVRELTAALEKLFNGEIDWETLSINARIRHKEEFSDVAMAQGVAKVYRHILR